MRKKRGEVSRAQQSMKTIFVGSLYSKISRAKEIVCRPKAAPEDHARLLDVYFALNGYVLRPSLVNVSSRCLPPRGAALV